MSSMRRAALSRVLSMFARMTAEADSHSAAALSSAERRSRARSVSTSFWCMRSVMLPDEAYSASRLARAFSRFFVTCSYSRLTLSA